MMRETKEQLLGRIRALSARVEEAEETLRAIRDGEVDAIVAAGPEGDRVYTLKGADAAYRVMIEEMAEGAVTLDPHGLILFANKPFAFMLGLPLDCVIGASIQEFVASEDLSLVSVFLQSSGRRKAEVRLIRPGGSTLPVYLSLQNLILGGVACCCCVVTDLSEQKLHAELAALLETVPVGVYISKDVECKTFQANRKAYELLRIPDGEGVGRIPIAPDQTSRWRYIKDGKEIPNEDLPLVSAARTGKRVDDFEVEVLFDDGDSLCLLGNAVPLFDKAGKPSGAVGAFVDITERRQVEESMLRSNLELKAFGNALTQDLRDPLTMIVKFTRLLAEDYKGRPVGNANLYIKEALESALRIEGLVKGLSEYWSLTQRSGLNLSLVDCNRVFSRTLEKMAGVIQENGAQVSASNLPTVVAEEPMLDSLFEMLIGNAIQYCGNSTPQVQISADSSADRWLFSVRDNGIGVEKANLEKVFGIFHRLHGDEIPGTGIGLPLCRQMVERHGGRIWLESIPGTGSAVRFTIPSSLEPAGS
jgi:PAS domain S-box-containing protein